MGQQDAKAHSSVKAAELDQTTPPAEAVSFSFEELTQRASAKTEILKLILRDDHRPLSRNWGLNE